MNVLYNRMQLANLSARMKKYHITIMTLATLAKWLTIHSGKYWNTARSYTSLLPAQKEAALC